MFDKLDEVSDVCGLAPYNKANYSLHNPHLLTTGYF